jgi:hypothetical protein
LAPTKGRPNFSNRLVCVLYDICVDIWLAYAQTLRGSSHRPSV